jgi:hypothetical protein
MGDELTSTPLPDVAIAEPFPVADSEPLDVGVASRLAEVLPKRLSILARERDFDDVTEGAMNVELRFW